MCKNCKITHLHNHSANSLADGASSVDRIVQRAVQIGSTAVGLTDHGTMLGTYDLYLSAKKYGIKPIYGCEFYITRDGVPYNERVKGYHHQVILAQNMTGLRNMYTLSKYAHGDGFYYKPRIDKELLFHHSDGLIVTSSCLAGEIPHLVVSGKHNKAEEVLREYLDIFGERFFLEAQFRKDFPEQEKVNKWLWDIAPKYGVKVIGTSDAHYASPDEKKEQEILKQMGSTAKDGERDAFSDGTLYLVHPDEIMQWYGNSDVVKQWMNNTLLVEEIVENFSPDNGEYVLPIVELPQDKPITIRSDDHDAYLAWLAFSQLEMIYEVGTPLYDRAMTQLDFELATIKRMKLTKYLLIIS